MMNQEKVKKWLVRAWGNAKIGWEQSKLPYHVINDMDNLARAFGLTDEDKEYAINLMDGDVYELDRDSWTSRYTTVIDTGVVER